MSIEKLFEGIYRIVIPFNNIYTSAFLLTEGEDAIIFDSGASSSDAEKYIIPLVNKLSVNVKYIVISHSHSDHSGGYARLSSEYPLAEKADFSETGRKFDGYMLLARFSVYSMKGHSADGLSVFDTKTRALFTADALQQRGIDIYRDGISDREEYLSDIEKIRKLSPEIIIASHDYDPLGFIAKGREEIESLLKLCKQTI